MKFQLFLVAACLVLAPVFAIAEDGQVPLWISNVKEVGKTGKPEMIITDKTGADATLDQVNTALDALIIQKKPIPIKIYLVLQTLDNLDIFGKNELHYGIATTITSEGNPLKTDARTNNGAIRDNQVIEVGEVFGGNVTSTDDAASVKCAIQLIEDDGISMSDKEKAEKLMKDLKAFAEGDAGIGTVIVKYVPILPIVYDVFNLFFSDDIIQPTAITLTKSEKFIPSAKDVAWRGDLTQIAYVVQVGPYTFTRKDAAESEGVKRAILKLQQL